MKLTHTQIKVLRYIIACNGDVRPAALAETLWPGRTSPHNNAMAKCAGSLMGKYQRMGILTAWNKPTQAAIDALSKIE